MTETNIETIKENPWSIKISLLAVFATNIARIINSALVFFGLRSKHKFWGIVYDSVTKQPLDPAIVQLIYADQAQHVETSITDMEGRYGFMARPGKFKLYAKKSNYSFPSKIVSGSNDGPFDNVYHGEFIELVGDHEVLAPNIPMDPVNPDWNQTAKLAVVQTSPYANYLFRSLVVILFWFGLAFVLVFAAREIVLTKMLYSWTLRVLLGAYFALLILSLIAPSVRLWGRVKYRGIGFEIPNLLLRLANPRLPNVILGKAEVNPDGKYFLRANPGKYLLQVQLPDESGVVRTLATLNVTVHKEGVLNTTLIVDK